MGLIQDQLPWSSNSDTTVATGLGYTVTLIPSSSLATANLSAYSMIVLAGSQSTTTYSNVQTNLARIQAYVAAGGVWVVNDASSSMSTPYGYTLLPAAAGVTFVTLGGSNIDVLAPGSGLINGPGGTITNTTLDGGNYSDHGYTTSTLPPGSTAILNDGTASQVVAFDYPDGLGHVICHTIPVEYYAGTGNFGIFHKNLFNFAASFANASGNDYYSDQLNAGQVVTITTSTPAGDPGQFVNTLSPNIQLYDPSRNVGRQRHGHCRRPQRDDRLHPLGCGRLCDRGEREQQHEGRILLDGPAGLARRGRADDLRADGKSQSGQRASPRRRHGQRRRRRQQLRRGRGVFHRRGRRQRQRHRDEQRVRPAPRSASAAHSPRRSSTASAKGRTPFSSTARTARAIGVRSFPRRSSKTPSPLR